MEQKIEVKTKREVKFPPIHAGFGEVKAINLQSPSLHGIWLRPCTSDTRNIFKIKRLQALTPWESENISTVPVEFKRAGIAISMCSYRSSKRNPGAKRENICAIKMVAVDCDYSDERYSPLEIYEKLASELQQEKE